MINMSIAILFGIITIMLGLSRINGIKSKFGKYKEIIWRVFIALFFILLALIGLSIAMPENAY